MDLTTLSDDDLLKLAKSQLGGLDVSSPPVSVPNSTADIAGNFARQGGLTSRGILEGIGSFAGSLANAPAYLYNKGADVIQGQGQGYRFPEQNQALSNALTYFGLPKPETTTEKISNFGLNAISGTGYGNVLGRTLSGSKNPIVKSIGDQFNANPFSSDPQLPVSPTEDSVKAASIKAGQDAGYVAPPSEVKTSFGNTIGTTIANRSMLEQSASVKNQAVTNQLARQDLGLGSNAPLTSGTLNDIRNSAGQAYQAVKEASGNFQADKQFTDAMSNLGQDYSTAAKEFPDIASNPAIDQLKQAFSNHDMSPKALVEVSKKLRFDASKNFLSEDPAKAALASAQKDAANAVEGLIDRNLQARGQQDLFNNWINARQLIAKTYTYEGALNTSTGNIIAPKLGNQLTQSSPLSGGARIIANFSKSLPPQVTAEPLKGHTGFTFGDVLLGGGLSAVTSNPAYMAWVAARPALRSLLLSKPYQSLMTQQATPNLMNPQKASALANILRASTTQQE